MSREVLACPNPIGVAPKPPDQMELSFSTESRLYERAADLTVVTLQYKVTHLSS